MIKHSAKTLLGLVLAGAVVFSSGCRRPAEQDATQEPPPVGGGTGAPDEAPRPSVD
jgi:hypothetical protein